MIWLTLGLAALGNSQRKRPLSSTALNLRKRRTEPLNCCPFMTSLGPLFTRKSSPILENSTPRPSGKYQSPRVVRTVPDSVPQQSTRSVMHCKALSSRHGSYLMDQDHLQSSRHHQNPQSCHWVRPLQETPETHQLHVNIDNNIINIILT